MAFYETLKKNERSNSGDEYSQYARQHVNEANARQASSQREKALGNKLISVVRTEKQNPFLSKAAKGVSKDFSKLKLTKAPSTLIGTSDTSSLLGNLFEGKMEYLPRKRNIFGIEI